MLISSNDGVCDLIVATVGRTEKASGVVRMTKEGTKSFSQGKRTTIVDNNVIMELNKLLDIN